MTQFARDAFTGTGYANLDIGRTADVGGAWTRHTLTSDTRWYLYNNRVHCGAEGLVYIPATPAAADYYVEADYLIYTDVWGAALAARIDTSSLTCYAVWYQAGQWVLVKYVNGGYNWIGNQYATSYSSGASNRVRLTVSGGATTTVTVTINGTVRITATDSSSAITAAGKVGMLSLTPGGTNDVGSGKHIDNFVAEDGAAASTTRGRVVWFMGI